VTLAAGIGVSLQSRLSPFLVFSGLDTEVQPRNIRVVNVPEYYAEYRETGNGYCAFLGSSIVAKVSLHLSKAQPFLLNEVFRLSSMTTVELTTSPKLIIPRRGHMQSSNRPLLSCSFPEFIYLDFYVRLVETMAANVMSNLLLASQGIVHGRRAASLEGGRRDRGAPHWEESLLHQNNLRVRWALSDLRLVLFP
jgi:hypothetical protein